MQQRKRFDPFTGTIVRQSPAAAAYTTTTMATFADINDAFPLYYEILGVPANATRRDISRAYRALALSEHPDRNGGTPEANVRFANINQARDVLNDANLRADYDKQLYQRQREARDAQRSAQEAAWTRAAEEQRRAQAFAHTPAVPASAFDHAFRRDRGGHGPPTTSWFMENTDADVRFRDFLRRSNLPFGKYGTPEVPGGEGAWIGTSRTHPVWNQAADVWAACSSLCHLAVTVEKLLRELERVAHKAMPKQMFTAFVARMPDDHAQKYHCGIELLWDILRFSGSGYVAVKSKVENIKLRSPADAIAEMNQLTRQLDKVHIQMLSVERAITNQITQIIGRTADATALWKAMELVCRMWDRLVKLPDVIRDRIEMIFKDGEYVPGWKPQGEFYPVEGWKQSRKKHARKRTRGKGGRKGSKDSKSSSDGIT